jgi:hypothetical protein
MNEAGGADAGRYQPADERNPDEPGAAEYQRGSEGAIGE